MVAGARPGGRHGEAGSSFGDVLSLVRANAANSRADLARVTGLSRSTASQRVDALIELGLIVETGDGESTGGRRPTMLVFAAEAGLMLAADFGASHCRLGITDRTGTLLVQRESPIDIADGPERCLGFAIDGFEKLLADLGRSAADVEGVGVGLPGPVEFAAGRVVNPPIMPGWHGVPVPPFFAERFPGAPVLVDNDVNVMALGEYTAGGWSDAVDDLLYVKVGTGIGCGIVAGGQIHRGAQGAAGDLGHVPVSDSETRCHCGNIGCVEAVASGAAIAAALRDAGVDAGNTADVVALARAGHPVAVPMVRTAGRRLGEVLAGAVNFFNPSVIVLGGGLDDVHEHLIAGVREVIYRRSTALATHRLDIARSRLGREAGVIGCATMAVEHTYSPAAVNARVAELAERGR